MAPVAGDTSEDEDSDEEVEENDTSAPRMYAYEYDAKTNELNQVRIVTNPAEEDYLGIQTKEVQTEATAENEAKTSAKQLSELLEKCTKGTAVTLEIHRTIPAENEGAEPTEQILTGKIILDVRGNVLYRSTPNYVQGITFSGDRTIFSCSYGRNSTKKRFLSELQVYNRADATDDTMLGELELAVALPPMVEEVEVVGDLEGTDGKGQSTCPIDKMIAVKLGLDSIK